MPVQHVAAQSLTGAAPFISAALAQPIFLVIIALLVVLVAFLSRRGVGGDTILLVGPSGGGKTALLMQLYQGQFRATQTSMKENEIVFSPVGLRKSSARRVFVDFPGHGSQRPRLPAYFPRARAVIFVLDATDDLNWSATANFLFSLLVADGIARRRVPVLIACNKTDSSMAKSLTHIRTQLENHLETARKLQSSMPMLGELEAKAPLQLGRPGVPFKLEHSQAPIRIADVSVQNNQLAPVLEFLAPQF